jgi:Na+-translocating ferredoxin:NAD+ oxidoreductase subunit D
MNAERRSSVRFGRGTAPHRLDDDSTSAMMASVCLALIPVLAAALWAHGLRCLIVMALSVGSALAAEAAVTLPARGRLNLLDGSALVTGLLTACVFPAATPPYIPAAAAAFAVLVGKQLFGGLGSNPFNPALVGRLFASTLWPAALHPGARVWQAGVDAATAATPLGAFRHVREVLAAGSDAVGADQAADAALAVSRLFETTSERFLFWTGGCIGETSGLLLLAGAGFLVYRRVIGLKIPLAFLCAAGIMAWAFAGLNGPWTGDPVFQWSSGGMLFAAFFMATDPVTSPVTTSSRIAFGACCGALCMALRLWGPSPEGAATAVLLANAMNALGRRARLKSPGPRTARS